MKIWEKLIGPVIALALLIVGVVVVRNLPDNSQTTESTTTQATVPEEESANLPLFTETDIVQFSLMTKDGESYVLSKNSDSADGETIWKIDAENAEGYAIDQKAVSSVVNALITYSPKNSFTEGMENLEDFGLKDPAYTVEMTMENGDVKKVYFGNMVIDDEGVYCISDDSNAIAIIEKSKMDHCQKTLLDFISKDIVTLTPEDVDYFEINRREDARPIEVQLLPQSANTAKEEAEMAAMIGKEVGDESVRYESKLTAPLEISGSDEFMTSFLQTILNVKASSFIDLTPQDLSQYFLDEPAYTIIYHTKEDGEIRIDLSENTGGQHFAKSSQAPVVFTIDANSISGLQTPFLKLVESFAVDPLPNISVVEKIEYAFPEGKFVFEIDVSTGGSTADEESTVLLNGVDAKIMKDSRSTYITQLYMNTLFTIDSFDFDEQPVGEPDITIEYKMKNGESTLLEFHKRDEKMYFLSIDGRYQGHLIYATKLYGINNPDDLDTYGLWDLYEFLLETIDKAENGFYPMPTKTAA